MSLSPSPLVSIIIPCYKAEKELPQALESVIQQRYHQWELIVINDGWEDKTEAIIDEFKIKCPHNKITYLKHVHNQGLGATRNTGIQKAQGNFIAFLDHDDVWEPNHLSHGLEILKKEQSDIYYSSVMVFDSLGKTNDWIWGPTEEDLINFPQSLYARNYIQPSAVIISKQFLNTLGLMDTNSKVHFCEDHDFWIRAITLNGNFSTSNQVTVRYRYSNPNAATAKIPLMLEHDISVQKKNLYSKAFKMPIKKAAIANNYRRLSDYYWKNKHLYSLYYLFLSLYWDPRDLRHWVQLLKGIVYWPLIRT